MGTREEMQGTMGTCIGDVDDKMKKEKKDANMMKKQTAEVVYGNAGIARKRCEIPIEDLYNLMGKQTEMRQRKTENLDRTHCERFDNEKFVHHHEDDDDDEDDGLSHETPEGERKRKRMRI